jgi:type VI secretion system VasD/TssJ family lipoprotein
VPARKRLSSLSGYELKPIATRCIWLLLLVAALCSCASAPTELVIEDDDWVYEDRAISITVKAPSDLNSVSGRPHSLALGVFQLNDPNTFSGLSTTMDGAVQLLQKGRIDDTVANFTIVNIRPGEQRRVQLNRAKTAQYVGLIAGYFELNPKNDVELFPIPLKAIKRGLVEKGLVALSLMTDEAKALPDKLHIYVELGRTSSKQIISISDKQLQKLRTGAGGASADLDWVNKVK